MDAFRKLTSEAQFRFVQNSKSTWCNFYFNFKQLKSERDLTLSISMFFENENSEIEGQLFDGLKKNDKNLIRFLKANISGKESGDLTF